MIESIKTYLIEYPDKDNFPKTIYDAAYDLVEYATTQFESICEDNDEYTVINNYIGVNQYEIQIRVINFYLNFIDI